MSTTANNTVDDVEPVPLTLSPESLSGRDRASETAWNAYQAMGSAVVEANVAYLHRLLRELWPTAGKVVVADDEEEGGGSMQAVIAVRDREDNLVWFNPSLSEQHLDVLGWIGDAVGSAPLDEDTQDRLTIEYNSIVDVAYGFFERLYDKRLRKEWYPRVITVPEVAEQVKPAKEYKIKSLVDVRAACEVFARMGGPSTPDGSIDLQMVVVDLLGDLRHLAADEGFDYDEADLAGAKYFAEERRGAE